MEFFVGRRWAGRGLLLCASMLVGLVALELGLRASTAVSPTVARAFREWDPMTAQIELLGERCYRPRPGAAFHYANGTVAHVNAQGYRGREVRRPKPAGIFRVVLLGGSTSHGFDVNDDDTIDAHLARWLAGLYPATTFEVVNLGFDGYDSGCDYERLRADGLFFEPDAVIVHSGINDVPAARFSPPRPEPPYSFRSVLARLREERRRGGPSAWSLLKHHLLTARAPGLLWHRRVPLPGPIDGPPSPPPRGPDGFETNLRRIAGLAGSSIVLLFSTPPSSLRGSAMVRPEWRGNLVVDAATTQRYRDALDERMRRVAAELAAGGRRAAYVAHLVPLERFLDDCHLDGTGNRLIAADFAAALARFLDTPPAVSKFPRPVGAAPAEGHSVRDTAGVTPPANGVEEPPDSEAGAAGRPRRG